MRDLHDHYFREAKREGYLSRAAYKLIEIDDKKKVLRPGDRVLDCGCAPGSWLQVAAKRVGPKGAVVGIDLEPIKFRAVNVKAVEADFTLIEPGELLAMAGQLVARGPASSSPTAPSAQSASTGGSSDAASKLFDVILSDMAPATTGDPGGDHHRSVRLCHALLDRCSLLLKPGGNLVMKAFEGEAYPELLKRTEAMFECARGYKPKASRSESTEMYIVALDHQPAGKTEVVTEDAARPKSARSTGWASR